MLKWVSTFCLFFYCSIFGFFVSFCLESFLCAGLIRLLNLQYLKKKCVASHLKMKRKRETEVEKYIQLTLILTVGVWKVFWIYYSLWLNTGRNKQQSFFFLVRRVFKVNNFKFSFSLILIYILLLLLVLYFPLYYHQLQSFIKLALCSIWKL